MTHPRDNIRARRRRAARHQRWESLRKLRDLIRRLKASLASEESAYAILHWSEPAFLDTAVECNRQLERDLMELPDIPWLITFEAPERYHSVSEEGIVYLSRDDDQKGPP